jgi:hypothetical protein
MTRRRALLLSMAAPAAAQPARRLVEWTPVPIFVGAPVLFKAVAAGPSTWFGKKIEFRSDGSGGFSALAGVGLDQAPGTYPLAFNGETVEVPVRPHAYPSSTIRVPPRFVEPPKEVQARIDEESALKRKVFQASPPDRLWQGAFVATANTRHTTSF